MITPEIHVDAGETLAPEPDLGAKGIYECRVYLGGIAHGERALISEGYRYAHSRQQAEIEYLDEVADDLRQLLNWWRER